MKRTQKKQIKEFLLLLEQAHIQIKKAIERKQIEKALQLLEDCQEGAISLGNLIEQEEGEGFITISMLEEYCELTYQFHERLINGTMITASKGYKQLRQSLVKIMNSVKDDIKERLQIVFLPYKASMWDSLESIWMAADADENCDAYVIPIPYYERNRDGTLGNYHYEGSDFPDYVPITHYNVYHLENQKPDIIYIHNPYDYSNYVTTIEPHYYSAELKKHTECLVYVPYYATAGNMNEGQSLCQAYLNVDYIIIQAEKYRKFFDPIIPQRKLLPFGSPKFDRVIRLCNNPPAPPVEWKTKIEGKKIYFFNTSIGGMLAETRRFLLKMEYVFNCFKGRNDICLIWRPHPLLESTFDSMRAGYRPIYEKLKQYFIQDNIGIFDDTPDIEKTIALCDVYIGDAATSLTSLFGVAGKPMFILNNSIYGIPEEDDWRGEMIKGFFKDGYDDWKIIQGNNLYHAKEHDYNYAFYCELSKYTNGAYYSKVIENENGVFVCPANAQDILNIMPDKTIKKIELKREIERDGAFCGALAVKKYIFLMPYRYPYLVRFNTENNKIDYIEGCKEFYLPMNDTESKVGGKCTWNNYILLASPVSNSILTIESETLEINRISINSRENGGYMLLSCVENSVYLFPYTGTTVDCWNPDTGMIKEYSKVPENFFCFNRIDERKCMDRPFSSVAVADHIMVLAPFWGNMFVSVDLVSGETKEWMPPMNMEYDERNGYFRAGQVGYFVRSNDALGNGSYLFYSEIERKLYNINILTNEYNEIEIKFSKNELLEHEHTFGRDSEWLMYGCVEKSLYSLNDFLNEKEVGEAFNREEQIKAFNEIAVNIDGDCGKKIHDYMKLLF